MVLGVSGASVKGMTPTCSFPDECKSNMATVNSIVRRDSRDINTERTKEEQKKARTKES